MSPPASCNPPGRLIRKPIACPFEPTRRPYSVLLPMGFTVPPALLPARWALTPPFHPYPVIPAVCPKRYGRRGGLLSVALSLGSPPPGVTRHRVSMEPGLSSPAAFRHMTGAAARPTDSAHIATIPRQRNRLCEKIAIEIRKAGSKTAAGFSFTSGNLYSTQPPMQRECGFRARAYRP
ncbi:hypothetical protein BR141012304_11271 [Brucella inopinata]|nr:hypothetical protein BR141012304_11271 [Brucella inopinata]